MVMNKAIRAARKSSRASCKCVINNVSVRNRAKCATHVRYDMHGIAPSSYVNYCTPCTNWLLAGGDAIDAMCIIML